jgi:uncharacterized protein YndB with AHSA1/START domain
MAAEYVFVDEWDVAAPQDKVFDALADARTYPRWWTTIYQAVSADGPPEVGRASHQRFKGKLPYTLSTVSTITALKSPETLEVEVDGDLRGRGIWTLTPQDGVVHVRFDWRVHADRPLIRVLTPVLRPLFRWNHNVAIRAAMRGLEPYARGEDVSTLRAVKPHRAFDPRRVGCLECAAWVAYYRREWLSFLRAAILLTRHTFALPWPATVRGAWLVLRANQLWAPFPDNDPEGARRSMQRFYTLVARHHGEQFDPARAAELEVEWWRVHRHHQHGGSSADERALVNALASLYSYVYAVPERDVQVAAEQRALAMDHSDVWVKDGCDPRSPLILEERAALVRSYAGLLAAVHRP